MCNSRGVVLGAGSRGESAVSCKAPASGATATVSSDSRRLIPSDGDGEAGITEWGLGDFFHWQRRFTRIQGLGVLSFILVFLQITIPIRRIRVFPRQCPHFISGCLERLRVQLLRNSAIHGVRVRI